MPAILIARIRDFVEIDPDTKDCIGYENSRKFNIELILNSKK